MNALRIENHAPGFYTIAGYHPTSRHNEKGQHVACPTVCEIVFTEPGANNGVTPEILEDVIRRHRAEGGESSTPVASPPVAEAPKNKGGRPRKNPLPVTDEETADAA